MTRTAGIYARISRDREGDHLGVQRQQDDCQSLAAARGWSVGGTYIDDDRSAYSGKRRPEYDRLLADIGAGAVDAVVVWHPDRLHRRPMELEQFIEIIEATRTEVATVTAGDLDLATPDGRLMARIVGSVARKESEDKSRRLRRKHLELAQNGQVSGGGRRPFGFEKDRVTIRPDEALLIREAAGRVLAGDSIRSIVYDWRERPVKTVTGAEWSSTTVSRLLKSGRISGQREHHGEIVGRAEWPAIIDPDHTARLRAILSDPARRPGGTTARRYLLTGFIWCGRCDVKMTTRPTAKGKGRYACTRDRGGCDRCGITAEGLEEFLTEALFARLDTAELAQAIADRQILDHRPIDEIAKVEQRMHDLAEMFAASEVSRKEWTVARDALEERMSRLQTDLASQTTQVAAATLTTKPGALRAAWPDVGLEKRRTILSTVIDSIVVKPTTKANNRFDPDRVAIVWR